MPVARLILVPARIKVFIVGDKPLYPSLTHFLERLILRLEKVVFPFGEKENLFEIHGETVANTGGQGIGFVPDNDIAQGPAPLNHFKGETEGNQAKRFSWHRGFRPNRPVLICAALLIQPSKD